MVFPGSGRERLTGERIVKVPGAKAFSCTVYLTPFLTFFCTPSMPSFSTAFLTPPIHSP